MKKMHVKSVDVGLGGHIHNLKAFFGKPAKKK